MFSPSCEVWRSASRPRWAACRLDSCSGTVEWKTNYYSRETKSSETSGNWQPSPVYSTAHLKSNHWKSQQVWLWGREKGWNVSVSVSSIYNLRSITHDLLEQADGGWFRTDLMYSQSHRALTTLVTFARSFTDADGFLSKHSHWCQAQRRRSRQDWIWGSVSCWQESDHWTSSWAYGRSLETSSSLTKMDTAWSA